MSVITDIQSELRGLRSKALKLEAEVERLRGPVGREGVGQKQLNPYHVGAVDPTASQILGVDSDAKYFQWQDVYLESEFIDTSAGAGDAGKPIKLDSGGHVDATMINDADISHDSIADVSADDHHNESHTVASHSDTTATGAELETLTDGSDADSLHTHATLLDVDDYVKVVDSKANTTAGGTPAVTTWTKRTVTEETDPNNLCTVTSSVIVLSAGDYVCNISSPGYQCNVWKIRLRNTTAGTTLLPGTSEYSLNTNGVQVRSHIVGKFTVAASQNLEIQYYAGANTGGGNGLGVATSSGENEIYTVAEFWKVG